MAYLIEILDDEATRQTVHEWAEKHFVRIIEPHPFIIETTPGYVYQPTPAELELREKLAERFAEHKKTPRPEQNWRGVISKKTAEIWLEELKQMRNEWH